MDDYFLFVRFFFDYTDRFPFERFASVRDADRLSILQELCGEWLSDLSNRRFLESGQQDIDSLSVEPVLLAAGWKVLALSPGPGDWLVHGISPRYTLFSFEGKDVADATCKAIQLRVDELAKSRSKENPDALYAIAGPHCSVVPRAGLLLHEQMIAREQIDRLRSRKGKSHLHPSNWTDTEAVVRCYMPRIRDFFRRGGLLRSASAASPIERAEEATTAANALLAAKEAPPATSDDLEWTRAQSPSDWRKVFRLSWDTLKRRMKDGKIRYKKLTTKSYQLAIADLPDAEQEKFRTPRSQQKSASK
jgi:hypothetical protein